MPLPPHLFASDDGALYDTRRPGWSGRPPLRHVWSGHARDIETTAQVKAALRAGEYTDFGGYPLYFVASDGCALSFDAVRDNLASVLDSVRTGSRDGWRVVSVDINYEDGDLRCEHTGVRIPSAYAEEEESVA
jgi:hypothetical protein